jgi:phosphatidylglycerophosphate synthase
MLAVMTTYSLADVRAVCKQRDAWWTVLLVDPIACRLVRFLASRTSVKPNQVTALAFLMGLGAAACFSLGEWRFLALGAAFFHLGFIFDCVDGKLARLTGKGSTFGLWLDFSLDQLRMVLCSFALAYGLHQTTGRPEAAYLAGLIIAFDLVRYLNGPQMAKVRRTMREQMIAALRSSQEANKGTAALERLIDKSSGDEEEVVREPTAAYLYRAHAKQGLHSGFRSRFPWYDHLRQWLLTHRIRTHVVSGIEYQMAVFVVGPLLGAALLPYVVVVAGLLLVVFECALVYKLWMSTRDFKRVMRRMESKEKSRMEAPLVR